MKKIEESLRQLHKGIESKMFPHFLVIFQWTLLVMSIAFSMNLAVAVTGAVANDGLKVIMLFHLWVFVSAIVLCPIFYRMRKEGMAERYIASLSVVTLLFSTANISLHFVDDSVLLMKASEVVAWGLYNIMFSISVHKVLVVLLPSIRRRFPKTEKQALHNEKKIWASDQKWEERH